jgi:hypothetical protein
MFDREPPWHRGGRGPGGPRSEPPPADDAPAWIRGALPDDWFVGTPDITIDRDEILIVGALPEPAGSDAGGAADQPAADRAAAEQGRIAAYREETRDRRVRLAQQLEHRYRRKVSWGVRCGQTKALFTTYSAPVMTRLRQGERQVLDTLVDSGVARSRSEALAWCVRLVGEHADQWLGELRTAMSSVDELRRRGPDLGS